MTTEQLSMSMFASRADYDAAVLEQRIAELEAERANAAAHVASIARQLGDEALQVDDIAVRVLGLVAERDALRAKLAEIEAREPACWAPTIVGNASVRGLGQCVTAWIDRPAEDHPGRGHCQTPLYARPVPAQVVPDGWRLAPADPTPEMLDAGRKRMSALGMYTTMIAAAPEHKA